MRDLWYKDALIYCLDVESFQDSNGDGIGDFAGLCKRLDYLVSLGVNTIWLLPFFPSPNLDNGYDVTDYYSVDQRLGTLGDFVEFMHQAKNRGLRVLIDLVVNHTSDQHQWFIEAQDPKSRKHDFYVWSETKPDDADQGMVFPGEQHTTWTYSEQAGKYYFHRFYDHQPELNIANPEVREEICKIIGYWLALGVSGFRMDAAPFVIEVQEAPESDPISAYKYLRFFRDFLSWRRGDAILLAEANVKRELISEYFGDGSRLHMLFNFLINQPLFLALAKENAEPLKEALLELPEIPPSGTWANFLRNHDELDLDRLDDKDRDFVFEKFAPKENMRIYKRGIRRRLAPMLDNDLDRLRMAYSLMFSLPGTPVMRYGEEIGMGDDLSLEQRNSVRTVMQWSDGPNGGFSAAGADELVRPTIADGDYGYQKVNVEAQRRDRESLLSWLTRLMRTWVECPEFGWGTFHLLESGDPAVLAHICQRNESGIIAVHNLSSTPRTVRLDLSRFDVERVHDLMGECKLKELDAGKQTIELGRYGCGWFRWPKTPIGL